MASRSLPYDAYGRVLPELTEAQQQVMLEQHANVIQRKRLIALLEAEHRTLLRKDVSARVTLSYSVTEGMINADIQVTVRRNHRFRS